MTEEQKNRIGSIFDLGTTSDREGEYLIISTAWIGEREDGYPCYYAKAIRSRDENLSEYAGTERYPVYQIRWDYKEEYVEEYEYYMLVSYRFSASYNGDPTTLCDWDRIDGVEGLDEDLIVYPNGSYLFEAVDPED